MRVRLYLYYILKKVNTKTLQKLQISIFCNFALHQLCYVPVSSSVHSILKTLLYSGAVALQISKYLDIQLYLSCVTDDENTNGHKTKSVQILLGALLLVLQLSSTMQQSCAVTGWALSSNLSGHLLFLTQSPKPSILSHHHLHLILTFVFILLSFPKVRREETI